MRKLRGSLTVEASLVLPLLLFLLATAINAGIALYSDCRDTVHAVEREETLDAVRLFYICNGVGDIIEDGDSLY